jgi:hypothetical protein
MQYDQYDRDNDQRVNGVAGFGESGIYTWTKSTEQPQHDQDYDDSPHHEISPIESSFICHPVG